MTGLRPLTEAEAEAKWTEYRAARRAAREEPPRLRIVNAAPVLDLGNARYHLFRGRPFGCPVPLAYQAGIRVAQLQLAIAAAASAKPSPATFTEYHRLLSQAADLIWSLVRPTGKGRRFLRAAGLLRNPFREAGEVELAEWLDFLSACRTMPSASSRPMMARKRA